MTPSVFLDGAPPRQPADRVVQARRSLRLVKRGGIERPHRHLLAAAGIVGVDFQQPMRLEVEIVAAIRNDVIFVLARVERNAVGGLLEEIDGRRSVERRTCRRHRRCSRGLTSSKAKMMSTVFALSFGRTSRRPVRLQPRNLRGKMKIFAQQIEAVEHPIVVRKQRFVALEAELLEAFRRAPG